MGTFPMEHFVSQESQAITQTMHRTDAEYLQC